MKKGKCRVLSLVLALGLLAVGCGSGVKGNSEASADTAAMPQSGGTATENGYAMDDLYALDTAAETEMAVLEEMDSGGTGSAQAPQVQDTQRKLIKNVNLEAETETFDELLATVTDKTERLGGYIENSHTYNGSSYYGNDRRNASLTIRIPAEKLDELLSAVSENSNVISQNESITDVTLQYVDMESHKNALLAEQKQLLELLEQAETIEDIISLESRLSDVRYQIESMESQLRTMDNQVSYSTVYLDINEVAKLTPVKEQSPWEKISTGFANSLYDVGSGLVNFGIDLIINLPYLILWAVIILVVLLIVRLIVKRKCKKRPGRQEKQPENKEQAQEQDTEIKRE